MTKFTSLLKRERNFYRGKENTEEGQKRRKIIRLKDFDYAEDGWYYITICAKNRAEIFCKIENGNVLLSEVGEIVRKNWENLHNVEAGVETLDFCIMPNHIHGILFLHQAGKTLGAVVRRFKSRVSREARQPVWQSNYYEHIIRNGEDYRRIALYILENPLNWEQDTENPNHS